MGKRQKINNQPLFLYDWCKVKMEKDPWCYLAGSIRFGWTGGVGSRRLCPPTRTSSRAVFDTLRMYGEFCICSHLQTGSKVKFTSPLMKINAKYCKWQHLSFRELGSGPNSVKVTFKRAPLIWGRSGLHGGLVIANISQTNMSWQ